TCSLDRAHARVIPCFIAFGDPVFIRSAELSGIQRAFFIKDSFGLAAPPFLRRFSAIPWARQEIDLPRPPIRPGPNDLALPGSSRRGGERISIDGKWTSSGGYPEIPRKGGGLRGYEEYGWRSSARSYRGITAL
ncbi:MAG: hypothetical protein ABSB32_18510, partial [Thermodesulfobacteriota bacterium]